MNAKRLLGIINEVTDDKSINVGEIEVTGKFTFFDVFEDQKDKLLSAFGSVDDLDVSVAKGSKSVNQNRDRKGREFNRNERVGNFSGKSNEDKPWRNRDNKRKDRKKSGKQSNW